MLKGCSYEQRKGVDVKRMKFLAMAIGAALAAMATPADELSLNAAQASAAKGDTAMLVSYAGVMRDGWFWGIAMLDASQLVDPQTFSEATAEKEPLRQQMRCVQKLKPQDLVKKALNSDPSSKVDTFSQALNSTIADLCPSPSLEIRSERHPVVMNAWILVLASQVQGGGGSHVELIAQETTNGHAFPTLNACQVGLLGWEHKMAAEGINRNSYALSCIKAFK
jgi:hypothetical protein